MKPTKQLNLLVQFAIFSLSPLILPSLLCLIWIIFSIFDPSWLSVASVPLIFSMALIIFPFTLVGVISIVVRQCVRFRSQRLNIVFWMLITLCISVLLSPKFMSSISRHFVETSYYAGIVASFVACRLILRIERKLYLV